MDYLTINRNDATSITYIIGVQSIDMICNYQISYTTSSLAILQLSPGITYSDHININEIDYFSVYFPNNPTEKLRLITTTYAGDPDIYISTTIRYPSLTNYTWRSVSYGQDVITIDPSIDNNACTNCVYYIAIIGLSESSYSLTSYLVTSYITLYNGYTINGHDTLFSWTYYQYFDTQTTLHDINIILTSMYGDSDIYITFDQTLPTLVNYQLKSNNLMDNNDIITINSMNELFINCQLNNPMIGCQILIGIYGYISFTNEIDYTISIHSNNIITLISYNVPINNNILKTNEYNYYKTILLLNNTNNENALKIQIITLSGELDMFFSCSDNYPSNTNYQWTFTPQITSNVYYITTDMLSDENCAIDSKFLYISVYGATNVNYNIIISLANNPFNYIHLTSNNILTNTINSNSFQWYYIRPGSEYEDIVITTTALSGEVSIYVCKDIEERAYYNEETNQIENYLIKSTNNVNNNNVNTLLFSHNSIEYNCYYRISCYYLIGIYSNYISDVNTNYQLFYTLKDSIININTGIPMSGIVHSKTYQYYSYIMTSNTADLIIILTSLTGDCDLFLSTTNKHPVISNFTWISMRYGNDILTIPHTELLTHCHNNTICNIFIGVYGYQNSSYSLIINTDLSYKNRIQLINGLSQNDFVGYSLYKYYEYYINKPNIVNNQIVSSVIINLISLNNNDADIYVTLSEESEPSKSNYIYSSKNTMNFNDEIIITPEISTYCVDCKLFIAIYGYSVATTYYRLTITTNNIIQLISGLTINGIIDTKSFRYYSFMNTNTIGLIDIMLTTYTGDADLYITTYKPNENNNEVPYPSLNRYVWHSLKTGIDSLKISYLDENYCYDCVYLIGKLSDIFFICIFGFF